MRHRKFYNMLPFIWAMIATLSLVIVGKWATFSSMLLMLISLYIMHIRRRNTALLVCAAIYVLALVYIKAHRVI